MAAETAGRSASAGLSSLYPRACIEPVGPAPDRALAAIGANLDDTSVRLEPDPHHDVQDLCDSLKPAKPAILARRCFVHHAPAAPAARLRPSSPAGVAPDSSGPMSAAGPGLANR